MIEAGKYYTLGKMKHSCGDRSYIGAIWLVLATNGKAALIKDAFGSKYSGLGRDGTIVDVSEFDWTPADDLAEAMLILRDPVPTPEAA